VGLVVCDFRRRAGVSQEQLGADCGFDRTYISRLERGILNPTIMRLWKIADSLNTPFHVMVKGMEDWVRAQEKGRR
jgi:transcriptional regulator with XRE-family HTH domain